ncbi:hypothetical protein GGH95_002858, partial [Coemansia sp. RSA 1836]
HPHTEYVPSPVSVMETELQTVTMCQAITVSVPVTEYDTICQIVTVEHTATMTKPVLVVQNVCTDSAAPAQTAPPAPPSYEGEGSGAEADIELDDLASLAKKSKKSPKKAVAKKVAH